jgi:hypothetical protein
MDIANAIWSFFVMTHEWYWGLWKGWFAFFKGILPWYWNLNDIGLQIFLGLLYFMVGLAIILKTGGVQYERPSKKSVIRRIQNALYTAVLSFVFPALFVFSFVITIPGMIAFFFYGLWLIVWMFVIMLAFLYCVIVWPLRLIFS